MLLDTELDISTQRSTGESLSTPAGGPLWTDCAPARDAVVALAEAEGEGLVEGVAFGVVLADGLSLALLCAAC